jgi:hypothetical protein
MVEFRLTDDMSLNFQKMICRVDQQALFNLKNLTSIQTNPVYTLHQPFCHLASLPR